jgi:hypothetical protein
LFIADAKNNFAPFLPPLYQLYLFALLGFARDHPATADDKPGQVKSRHALGTTHQHLFFANPMEALSPAGNKFDIIDKLSDNAQQSFACTGGVSEWYGAWIVIDPS